jgi:hypothetical protein
MAEPAVCPFCREVMSLSSGCDAPEARYTVRWGDELAGETVDWPCHDCAAHPGNQHHPGCCVAQCERGEVGQAMFCDCDLCSVPNEILWDAAQLDQLGSHPVWNELEEQS